MMFLPVSDEVPLVLVSGIAELAAVLLEPPRVKEEVGRQGGFPPELLEADVALELVCDPLVDNPHVAPQVFPRLVAFLAGGTLVLIDIV